MPDHTNIIAIYSRKSKFTGKGESIGNQIDLCKEYVERHFGKCAAEQIVIYEDEGFSGGNLNRPAFKKMMEAAKKRQFQAIIVYRLDRISRNVSDFSGLIEELSRLNIAFVSIKEQFDTSTPMGRAMMYIASVFSQLERETIAERIRDNMHELAKTGRWLGGTTPTGFASEAVQSMTMDGKTKKACKLKLIPEEAKIVKSIYDLYLETDSLTMTESALMQRGIKTKKGNYFTRFAIKSILQNPVYMIADEEAYRFFLQQETDLFSAQSDFDGVHGIMAYHRTDQEKGRATIYLPPKEWIVAVGKHPGLVPGKVWVTIQKSLARNKSKAFRKPRSNEALLTGLLFCSCGERMYPKVSKRKNAQGDSIFFYVCKRKEHSRRSLCNSKNVHGNTLDLAIMEQLKRLPEDQETFLKQLEQSRKLYTGNPMEWEGRLTELKNKKLDTEKKMGSLVDSLADIRESAARAQVSKRIEELSCQCDDLEKQIQEVENFTSQHALSNLESSIMGQMLSLFRDSVDQMTLEQKRSAIRAIVRKVIWDGTNAHVILLGVPDDEGENRQLLPHRSANHMGESLPPLSSDQQIETPGASKTPWGEDSK